MRNFLFILLSVFNVLLLGAQTHVSSLYKLSPYVRNIVKNVESTRSSNRKLVTFVSTESGNDDVLRAAGCRVITRMGNVYVVEIPLTSVAELSLNDDIRRIEAGRSCTALLDTTSHCIEYDRVWSGTGIPRAYTGKGVVMGIMDVGFDLTSPNFYTRDMSDYRIRKFWDMLATDKDTAFVVGREYVGRDAILALKHSTDNLIISHGTHTLGIAAGSGYNSNYVGVAPESEICLVNNAVVEDLPLISPEDVDKYTTATDALGFKYIFDYAESVGKPCVISFSEGSRQLFDEDNVLFYEALESLVGPGRILVASAGNDGSMKYVMHKPAAKMSAGSFVYSPYKECTLIFKTTSDFIISLNCYGSKGAEQMIISTEHASRSENKEYKVHQQFSDAVYDITITATTSAFSPSEKVFEFHIKSDDLVGARVPLSLEIFGNDDIKSYAFNSVFMENSLDPKLCDGTSHGTILTPASSPSVIAVGATSYRAGFVNYKGEYLTWDNGSDGVIAPYSSLGPTFDGRIKPDVVAPGTNVISSYSSYYIEAKPDAFDTQSDVTRYEYNGRTYSWNANTGTSMSSPVVGGIIALWLEANPNLSPDDIREILDVTCRRDSTLTYPNNTWGRGEINAYRGLCHILGIDGIEGISSEARDFSLVPSDGGFDICFKSELASDCTADVFSVDGIHVTSHHVVAGTSKYHVASSHGVYAVRVRYADGSYQSMLVRC